VSRDLASVTKEVNNEDSSLKGGRCLCSLQNTASEGGKIIEEEIAENKQGLFSAIKAVTRIIPGLWRGKTATERTRTPLLANETMEQCQSGSISSGDPLLVATSGDSGVRNCMHGTGKKLSHRVKGGRVLLRTAAGSSWNADLECECGRNSESVSKHEQRQAAQDEIRSLIELSLWQCLLAIFAYIAIAVLAFSVVFNHWTIIDSAYFAVVTFSNIGFGDLAPDTYAGRVFTCFFAISGVASLGIALGVVGRNTIIGAEHMTVKPAGEFSKHRTMTLFSSAETSDSSSHDPSGEELFESSDVPQPPPGRQVVQAMQRNPAMRILREFALAVVVLIVFASALSNDHGVNAHWPIGIGLYFSISKYRVPLWTGRLWLMRAATDLYLPTPSFRYNSMCIYFWLL
jgi:hypothetical protein